MNKSFLFLCFDWCTKYENIKKYIEENKNPDRPDRWKTPNSLNWISQYKHFQSIHYLTLWKIMWYFVTEVLTWDRTKSAVMSSNLKIDLTSECVLIIPSIPIIIYICQKYHFSWTNKWNCFKALTNTVKMYKQGKRERKHWPLTNTNHIWEIETMTLFGNSSAF